MLAERRSLTRGDEECPRLYCILFDRHAEALEHIALEGEIVTYHRLNNWGESVPSEKPNLWLKVDETCESKMAALAARLGFNARNEGQN